MITYHLRRRQDRPGLHRLLLVRRDGPAEACLMCGFVGETDLAAICGAINLPVETEDDLPGQPFLTEPAEDKGPAQKDLFGGET